MRIGIGISEDIPLPVQQGLAVEVETAGFASLWTNEARGRDALLTCQAWGAATTDLEVGVGVLPLWTRSPAQHAMAAATLQEATTGRFLMGIGVSHPGTMEPWHGVAFSKPLTAARELLTILDQLLDGGRSEVEGEVLSSMRFQLAISPPPPPPSRYLAAMGPRMLQLAGEMADGVLLNWACPAEVERAGGVVRDSAAEHGRGAVEVGTYVRVAVDDDRSVARAALAREIGRYAALPAYAAHLERQGFGAAVRDVRSAYREGGPEAVPDALDDDVLLALGWYGTPEDDPGELLATYDEAGLDHLVARVVVTGDDAVAAVRRTIRAVAGR